jgi:excisionase family DNA binding protein
MKSFTVKEISDLLNTNPETVRRWIRDGKMKAEQVTRKDGNLVTEDALKAFLKSSPKYARIAASTGALFPMAVGVPIAIGALVSGLLLELYGSKKSSEIRIHSDEFRMQIQKVITEHEESIQRKETSVEQLKSEIKNERKKVADLNALLENADFGYGVDNDTQLM